MDHDAILARVDHTLLTPQATQEEVEQLCREGLRWRTASVCLPPCFLPAAKKIVGDNLPLCTVIGFPNGYHSTQSKVFETKQALRDGADEVDMVICIGEAKAHRWERVLADVQAVRDACAGKVLKVIVETALLDTEEKIALCDLIARAGADFIKTSTGFSTAGATVADVRLFHEHLPQQVKIKAAGGIRSWEQAEAMLQAGAARIGASALVALRAAEG